MAVFYNGEHLLPEQACCVECGDAVSSVAVIWVSAETLIWHPECALRLGAHLIGDAREAMLAGDDSQPFWRGRAIATVRHRLRREEAVA